MHGHWLKGYLRDGKEIEGGGGSGGGALIVTMNGQTLNKTWQEINDAFLSGAPVFVVTYGGDEEAAESFTTYSLVVSVTTEVIPEENTFRVTTGNQVKFVSSSASDYPQVDMS